MADYVQTWSTFGAWTLVGLTDTPVAPPLRLTVKFSGLSSEPVTEIVVLGLAVP